MKVTFTIENVSGIWYCNGKRYQELTDFEKTILNEFFKKYKK